MKIIVDISNYMRTDNGLYPAYMNRGKEVEAPANPTYVVGQLVIVEHNDKKQMAVVLGCIDTEFDGEVRLDLCGMTCVDKIRPAVVTDFGRSDVRYPNAVYKECQGYKVTRNWDTHEYTFEEPTF
jgi:hypothetical protein